MSWGIDDIVRGWLPPYVFAGWGGEVEGGNCFCLGGVSSGHVGSCEYEEEYKLKGLEQHGGRCDCTTIYMV